MSLIRSIFERRDTSVTSPAAWLLESLGGGKTASGQRVTPVTAEGIPVVYACVSILAETVAQLPLKLVERQQRGKVPATGHPLYAVLHDLANPFMTASEFREVMMRWLCLWGDCYAEIERRADGNVVGLWPLATDRMTMDRQGSDIRYTYRLKDGGSREWVMRNPDNPPILHLRINSLDGFSGRSPITLLRESLGITVAADRHAGAFFGTGAMPDLVISKKGPGVMSKNARQNFVESWKEKFGGSAKAHGIALLEEDFTVTPLTMPAKDAQFLELRSFQIEDGARIYRVPNFMLGHTTNQTSWGSGIEEMGLGFVNFTLMPWLVRWTQGIARDCLTKKSFNTHEAVFIVSSLVRGDISKRYSAYAVGRQQGFLSGNDIRELEDMNEVAGLDEYWRPENMAVVGEEPEPAPGVVPPLVEPAVSEAEGVAA